ncbi:radical SAM protein [uncultured Ilyobacter sp.]|uniref:radical SAM protein n=1 Tax=uncultured Ilyobacter sp. TaxID=544433 RepID=UPI0029C81CCA|nr:radical SAM protein [uncultured Ilyobacter sp.]
MIVFGPVPSRRLGRSVGINNIPAKVCSYSCVYCQLGRSIKMTEERKEFFSPREIFEKVNEKIKKIKTKGGKIDYLTFVPDGEPTLDRNLGTEIDLLKKTGIKVAVITNASLIWREDVQSDLMKADLVSLKIDAVDKEVWRKIDRPYATLNLDMILKGIMQFSMKYKGKLITETMLVKGLNDTPKCLEEISGFLRGVKAAAAYISIPTRPPAEKYVFPPDEEKINLAYQIFGKNLEIVEYLIDYEGNKFDTTGELKEEILNITSVHPMKKEAVQELLEKADENWNLIEEMLLKQELVETIYQGETFYLRKF